MDSNLRKLSQGSFFQENQPREKIKFLLRYAILAPSTHNSQPWSFRIGFDFCDLFANLSNYPEKADPQKHDLYLSLGCCLENLVIAAKHFDVFDQVQFFPENNQNPVARISFKNLAGKPAAQKDYEELLEAILRRKNSRGLFQKTKVDDQINQAWLNQFQNEYDFSKFSVDLISDQKTIAQLAQLTGQGVRIAHKDKTFRKEMSRWIINSLSREKEGIPGFALGIPTVLSFFLPNLIRFFDLGPLLSRLNQKSLGSAPLICLVSAKSDEKAAWLEAGRVGERIMLEMEILNISTSIFAAALEIGDLAQKVQELLKSNARPLFLFAAGYLKGRKKMTLRYSVEERTIS